MDRPCQPQGLGFPVPQPRCGIAPPVDEAVRPDRPSLGGRCRPRVGLLRHAHDAQDQSFVDLPTHAKPSGRSALAWAHEAGEHRSLSGHRRRGRLGDRRADRCLSPESWSSSCRRSRIGQKRTLVFHLSSQVHPTRRPGRRYANEERAPTVRRTDFIALAWWKRPDIAFAVDPGQPAACAEVAAASAANERLRIPHHVFRQLNGDVALEWPSSSLQMRVIQCLLWPQ